MEKNQIQKFIAMPNYFGGEMDFQQEIKVLCGNYGGVPEDKAVSLGFEYGKCFWIEANVENSYKPGNEPRNDDGKLKVTKNIFTFHSDSLEVLDKVLSIDEDTVFNVKGKCFMKTTRNAKGELIKGRYYIIEEILS